MADSKYVFAPGERLTDNATGAPLIGATVFFFDAGTTTPRTVYATADLDQGDNPASLGTSVVTDSLGYPTSDGSTRTLIYVGTAPYKLVIKDENDVTIVTHDNIPGAVVSASSVDVSVTATFPVVTKSLDYTVDADDQNSTFLVNCSSGDVTLTLPSATDDDIPNGWKIKVQHAGSANQATIVVKSGSSQNIYEGTKTYGGSSFALALNGEDCEITADGGNWRVSSHTLPFPKVSIIPVVDRASTSPGTPQAGAFYLLTGVGGDFSTFTSGDIVQYTGAGWINWTPYTDCGWIAYVADEDQYYTFQGTAWVGGATASAVGMIRTATQSDQETSTSTVVAVAPGTQHYHPSAAKVWGYASVSGGTPSLAASYNMTSITDTGLGKLDITIATDFSSGNWSALMQISNGGTQSTPVLGGTSAGTAGMTNQKGDGSGFTDPASWYWAGFGDQ